MRYPVEPTPRHGRRHHLLTLQHIPREKSQPGH
nr:MAG TPA: hypothetical protein [Caudoviricetes sp.]